MTGREWHAERSLGGGWVAARVVEEGEPGSTTVRKVRQRRALDIPKALTRNEADAHIRALVRCGVLEP